MMKNKRDIYCEYDFWEAFYKMEDEILRDRNRRRLWDSFNKFLSANRLFFNIAIQDVNEETPGGKYIKDLMQSRGGANIKFIPQKYPQLGEFTDNDNYKLNAVYLTTKNDSECKDLSKRFGIIVFNLSMIFAADHVYRDNGISFVRNGDQNWNYLLNLRECVPSINYCNALVVVDRYLLYDTNENAFQGNLSPIFDSLLPDSLDNGIIFTICIIAEINKERVASIEEKYDLLESLIKELRPNLNFILTIYNSRYIHDRSIITNNIILTSGAGFDVIGSNDQPLRFTTTSLCFPFLLSDKNEMYLEWINNILKEKNKHRIYQQDYWGDRTKKNHLLDYYYERPIRPQPTYIVHNIACI